MRHLLTVLLFALLAPSASAQVSISINHPTYGFATLAGSVRTINAYITNGTTNEVNWSISATTGSASATLSCTSDCLPEVQVTIGSTAGTCSISGSMGSYAVSSTATVTLEAQSVDDNTKTATTTINVCSTAVAVYVAPFYRVLYANQPEDLQSWIVGSTNLAGTWSIASQPSGGNGSLGDTNKRDTVFKASVAGRYTVTFTSSADNTKSASAILYVTGNTMPYTATPEYTQPVDCTVDPNATGTDYEVGPARAYTTISAAMTAAFASAAAGDTIRIHNDDTTGSNPTTYHEYFQVGYNESSGPNNGTATQPVRVVGCPDSHGNLPIVDGNNATGASWVSTGAAAGYGIASVWPGPPTPYGYYQSGTSNPQYIIIEGIHFEHGSESYNYYPPGSGTETAYVGGASCINVRSGAYLVFDGNDLDTCNNGLFTDFNAAHAWAGLVLDTDFEGSYIVNSGISGSETQHQVYEQGWLELFQFNTFGPLLSGAEGNNFKERGVQPVLRYNSFGDAPGHEWDFVDDQDSEQYLTLESYLSTTGDSNCDDSFWCLGDTMGPNIVTAWQEAWQSAFAYGNTVTNPTPLYQIHYGADITSPGMQYRGGTFYFYNNTIFDSDTSSTEYVLLDDAYSGGCSEIQYVEFPQFQVANNIIWTPNSNVLPYWNCLATFIGNFAINLLPTWWGSISTPIDGSENVGGRDGNGWGGATNTYSWPLAVPLQTHMTGIASANFLTTSTQPFDSSTFIPPAGSAAINAGTPLTGAMAQMPVRFNYNPSTSVITTRNSPLTIGAEDPASSSTPSPPSSLAATVE